MEAEYCVSRDKTCFKRLVNVRQIFKEALAVFFMGTLVKRRRLDETKWEKRRHFCLGERCQGRRKKKEQAGENRSVKKEMKRKSMQGFVATCGDKCLVRTAGERDADPLRVYFSLPGDSWIISGAMEM